MPRTRENSDVFNSLDEIYMIFTSKKQISSIFQHTNRIHHGCPVEIGKSQPEGPPVPVGNEARRVSYWNGGPEGWDFPF